MKTMSKRLKFEMKSRDVIQTRHLASNQLKLIKYIFLFATLTGLISSCSKTVKKPTLQEKFIRRMVFTRQNNR